MKLPENIRRFRREENLTQEQLAEAMGIRASAVYKSRHGVRGLFPVETRLLAAPELCVILITHNLRETVRQKLTAVYQLG